MSKEHDDGYGAYVPVGKDSLVNHAKMSDLDCSIAAMLPFVRRMARELLELREQLACKMCDGLGEVHTQSMHDPSDCHVFACDACEGTGGIDPAAVIAEVNRLAQVQRANLKLIETLRAETELISRLDRWLAGGQRHYVAVFDPEKGKHAMRLLVEDDDREGVADWTPSFTAALRAALDEVGADV